MTPAVAIIPAYQAEATISAVVEGLLQCWARQLDGTPCIVVVDDGSSDATSDAARRAGAEVIRHRENRGKGVALMTGLRHAHALGAPIAVALDADGQHPPQEATRLLRHPAADDTLVLGIRNLVQAGAPIANQWSNAFSNLWLSGFCGRQLLDTQCGLRRYPVKRTLLLNPRARGFGFEAEVILRAARARWCIEQVPVDVLYPPATERVSHFHTVRDPFRIVLRVVYTALTATRQ